MNSPSETPSKGGRSEYSERRRSDGRPTSGRGTSSDRKPSCSGKAEADRRPSRSERPSSGRKPPYDKKPSHDKRPSSDKKLPLNRNPHADREIRRFDFNRSKASRSRLLAYECVREVRTHKVFAHEMIERLIDASNMDAADKAFAAKLVLGVVSMRGSLDSILDRAMRSPDDVTYELRDALVMSVYEIIYLEKSPHAAVDQGVELARAIVPAASGLANSVLRKVVALKPAFPFGDPRKDIEAYALLHGFPVWLVKELISDLGAAAAHEFMVASNTIAPLFVAVNDIRDTDGEVYDTLVRAKADPEPELLGGRIIPGCYRVAKHAVLNDGRIKRLINKGCMLVSDAAAQAVAGLVASVARPTSFLEIGAGRGTKTVMLQSDMLRIHGAQASDLVCVDNVERKVQLLEERASKYGVQVAEAISANALKLPETLSGRTFDTVFIDAPCTGLGTLRRHPEIRWRVTEEAIEEYADLGMKLMESASHLVAPDGVMAFSTCTVTKRENEGAVEAFLASEVGSAFALEKLHSGDEEVPFFKTALKPDGSDAHFCAILRKKA